MKTKIHKIKHKTNQKVLSKRKRLGPYLALSYTILTRLVQRAVIYLVLWHDGITHKIMPFLTREKESRVLEDGQNQREENENLCWESQK